MTIIEQIKAEIERRIKELNKDKYISADAQVCRTSELNYLLRFLSTLESEKPTDELGEEISESIKNLEGCTTKVGDAPEYHLISDEDLREFARHFAEWGAEHATRAETPTDLEEAAEEESLWAFPEPTAQGYAKRLFFKSGFNRGAKWDREQMMKDALHGWLDEDNEPPYDLNVLCEEKIPFGKFKHGDKVRIIIVKEDRI